VVFYIFAERGEIPMLPDFSYAGYHYQSKAVPAITGPVFDVTSFGVVPNSPTYVFVLRTHGGDEKYKASRLHRFARQGRSELGS
jgi:hypothetical protein